MDFQKLYRSAAGAAWKRGNVWRPLKAVACVLLACPFLCDAVPDGRDLQDVRKAGVLRHLGVPYANFITGSGDGLDVELVQGFAANLGVRYEYVKTGWSSVIPDLTGNRIVVKEGAPTVTGPAPIRGDIIACGLTIIAWRQALVEYATPIFPTQIWVIARADLSVSPIKPSGDENRDIAAVRGLLGPLSVLGKAKTCTDPSLYDLDGATGGTRLFHGGLNELAPAVIRGEADVTLLDVPDSLVALRKWPGQIKIMGPLSSPQRMAPAFRKTSPQLRRAFNDYLVRCIRDGTYLALVKKYYPEILTYYPAFFEELEMDAGRKS